MAVFVLPAPVYMVVVAICLVIFIVLVFRDLRRKP